VVSANLGYLTKGVVQKSQHALWSRRSRVPSSFSSAHKIRSVLIVLVVDSPGIAVFSAASIRMHQYEYSISDTPEHTHTPIIRKTKMGGGAISGPTWAHQYAGFKQRKGAVHTYELQGRSGLADLGTPPGTSAPNFATRPLPYT